MWVDNGGVNNIHQEKRKKAFTQKKIPVNEIAGTLEEENNIHQKNSNKKQREHPEACDERPGLASACGIDPAWIESDRRKTGVCTK